MAAKEMLSLRADRLDVARWDEEAKKWGLTRSDWMRWTLNRASGTSELSGRFASAATGGDGSPVSPKLIQ